MDSIFDDDNEVEYATNSRPSTSASTASSSSEPPLFLPENDDGDEDNATNGFPGPEDLDVDAIFDNVLGNGGEEGGGEDDDIFNYQPRKRGPVDYDAIEREAQARAKAKVPRRQILSSSPPRDFGEDGAAKTKGKGKDDGEKKEKRKPMRLDEARLVGPTGFEQLIEDTKHFRIKGKGHEATDLNRLLQIYQYWTHSMYPKSQFRDTVDRVEKLCHSKLMHNRLSMWRDKAHGKNPAENDQEEEEEADVRENENEDATQNEDQEAEPSRRASSSAPVSDEAAYASSSPGLPTRPPSSAAPSDAGNDWTAEDVEAFLAMEQEEEVQAGSTAKAPPSREMDIDDDDWQAFDEAQGNQSTTTTTTVSSGMSPSMTSANTSMALDEEDDEMWELTREMEAEDALKKAQATPTDHGSEVLRQDGHQHEPTAVDTIPDAASKQLSTAEEDFDDMYC